MSKTRTGGCLTAIGIWMAFSALISFIPLAVPDSGFTWLQFFFTFTIFSVLSLLCLTYDWIRQVPSGKYAVRPDGSINPPHDEVIGEASFYDLPSQRFDTIEDKTATLIVQWEPDEENLDKWHKGQKFEKFRELVLLNPGSFWEYAEALGIKVVSTELKEKQKPVKPQELLLGTDKSGNDATITYPARDKDIYIVGRKRSGKSTLMLNLIRQDLANGKGVAVLDPHGDLVDWTTGFIPSGRDVYYFSLDHPIGIDVLAGDFVSDGITIFKRFSERVSAWGQGMDTVLRYTLLALKEADKTFLDIKPFLTSQHTRKSVLKQVRNQAVVDYWESQFGPHYTRAAEGILSRMSIFDEHRNFRFILGQKEQVIDFHSLLQGKVLLAKLPHGDAGMVLGSILVSKIQHEAMTRSARVPFYLYVDEFQKFTTSSFEIIFSEAGKYGLSLTVANQLITDLEPEIKRAVGNAGTVIIFNIAPEDAGYFRKYTDYDLVNLPARKAIVWSRGTTQLIDTLPPPPPTSNWAPPIYKPPQSVTIKLIDEAETIPKSSEPSNPS